MAERRPLVEIAGEVQELPQGDNLPSTADILQRVFTSTVIPGEPMYVDGAGSVDEAQANASGTSDVAGVAPNAVTAAQSGALIHNGVVTLTTGQWDAVAGTSGGLTPSAKYFLSAATAGRLTETAPSAAGEYVVEVGEALSPTELLVRIRRRILKA